MPRIRTGACRGCRLRRSRSLCLRHGRGLRRNLGRSLRRHLGRGLRRHLGRDLSRRWRCRGSLLRSSQVVTDYRHSGLNIFINFLCHTVGQINAAVRTARFINRSAKGTSPRCIVHTNSAVKRHPVVNRSSVTFSFQYGISLLIGKRICSGRSCLTQNLIPPPGFRFYRRTDAGPSN